MIHLPTTAKLVTHLAKCEIRAGGGACVLCKKASILLKTHAMQCSNDKCKCIEVKKQIPPWHNGEADMTDRKLVIDKM